MKNIINLSYSALVLVLPSLKSQVREPPNPNTLKLSSTMTDTNTPKINLKATNKMLIIQNGQKCLEKSLNLGYLCSEKPWQKSIPPNPKQVFS